MKRAMILGMMMFFAVLAVPGASAAPGGMCEGPADVSCQSGGGAYCSPNDPNEEPEPDCSNGQWHYDNGTNCEVYTEVPRDVPLCIR